MTRRVGLFPTFSALSTCDKFGKARGFNFEVLRCDGAGENKSFVAQMNGKDWKFRITPQWTQFFGVCLLVRQERKNKLEELLANISSEDFYPQHPSSMKELRNGNRVPICKYDGSHFCSSNTHPLQTCKDGNG